MEIQQGRNKIEEENIIKNGNGVKYIYVEALAKERIMDRDHEHD